MKYFLLIVSLWFSNLLATELVFDPPNPVVSVGQRLKLSVSGTSGEIGWSVIKGQILGTGTSVTYFALAQPGLDAVTVLENSTGNTETVRITISNQTISHENAQWEVFTDRSWITALLLSEDENTLWVGTNGGLEQRDAQTRELQKVFFNTDGLPGNFITSLLNDGQGGLWIGTGEDGLAHWSKLGKWTIYNQENSALPSNIVMDLLSDGQGGLWIATGGGLGSGTGGLAHLSGAGEWTIYHPYNSELPHETITSLLRDEQGGLLIGTWGGLAYRSELGKWADYDLVNWALPSSWVTSLLSDGQGGLWVGTWDSGLAHRSRLGEWIVEWTVYDLINSGLPDNTVTSLSSDGQDGLWIGTMYGGLVHLTGSGIWTVYNLQNSKLASNHIISILRDKQGGLWIGTGSGLAYRSAQDEWRVDDSIDSALPLNNTVYSLLSDRQGGLWIGTRGGGLVHRSESGQWTVYHQDNSELPSNEVVSLLSDGQGGLWIGTEEGLAHLTELGEWTVYNQENSKLLDTRIQTLLSDEQGGLWIGTMGGLTYRNAQNEWKVYDKKNSGLPSNDVNFLISDGQGGLWIGTGYGLAHRSESDEWMVYDASNSLLPSAAINFLLSDDQGGLWIGTTGGGLTHRSSQNEWIVYNTENSGLLDNTVNFLLSDNQGGLWIGTEKGLVHWNEGGEWIVYNQENSGLPNNDVRSLLSDGQGGLWIGANGSGLAHLTFSRKTELCNQTQINDQTCQDLQQNQRAAILIAGGGAQISNSLWNTTKTITNRFYQMLYRRGFDHNEIYYLSPEQWTDFNGDGFNDRIIDAPTDSVPITLDDVKHALEWAKQRGQLTQPLYLFFMDHGGDGRLMLSASQELTANDFKALLDDYQTVTGNAVVVILEACHSGSFLQALQAPKRAIISSANSDELAYFIENRGFSYFLADYLLQGRSFYEAFNLATQAQNKLHGNSPELTGAIERGQLTSQTPQLDDNHDGLFTPADGEWLQTVYINGNFQTADSTLAVENLMTSKIIQAGQPLTLKAKVMTASGHVKSVWAIIRPPKMDFLLDIHGTPITAYPRLNFGTTDQENVWQTTWQETLYNGNYHITFYAQDHDNNLASSDESIMITVTDGINPPATANVQLQLGKTRYQRGEQFTAKLIENLNWGYDLYAAVVMPDGQFLTFKKPNEPSLSNQPDHWLAPRQQNEPLTLINLVLPQSLPTGEYCLYGILSPQEQPPMESQLFWKLGQQCFEVF